MSSDRKFCAICTVVFGSQNSFADTYGPRNGEWPTSTHTRSAYVRMHWGSSCVSYLDSIWHRWTRKRRNYTWMERRRSTGIYFEHLVLTVLNPSAWAQAIHLVALWLSDVKILPGPFSWSSIFFFLASSYSLVTKIRRWREAVMPAIDAGGRFSEIAVTDQYWSQNPKLGHFSGRSHTKSSVTYCGRHLNWPPVLRLDFWPCTATPSWFLYTWSLRVDEKIFACLK